MRKILDRVDCSAVVSKFVCVDGPEFDGHGVDFEELIDRLNTYRESEQTAVGEPCGRPV